MLYPAVNYGRFPNRPRNFFGHTSGSPLPKRSRRSKDLGMTDYTTSERHMRLSMHYGPNTTHTCPLASWVKTLLKSDPMGIRGISIVVNALTTKLQLIAFRTSTIFSPHFIKSKAPQDVDVLAVLDL